ncbi:glycosyltransferase [Desulfopila sp. IMCC35008]|uniref:glycosyltransferase n=1 Tax=Desulfopila sp. IMCC35008 TaxID=2653858 RepID=UPI0013D0C315|nr:glycosyltransferase [Desulfopila sp. IMCC35008]
MKTFKISIALATYNGAYFIREQLESFVAQTRLPDELVVCDDCSSDSTLFIVQQFAYIAPFQVKIIANEYNIGYANNFSKALSYCTGDIVLPSDQDDVWLPTKLLQVEEYFQEHTEIHLLIHDILFCKSNLTPIGQTKIERMRRNFDLQKDYVVGMASAIRGDFLRLCLPIPDIKGLSHDKWLHMCAQTLFVKTIINEVLALHRRHGANSTTGSPLNVDYVTLPDHFRKLRPGLLKRLSQMKADMTLRKERSASLLSWLEQGRDSFLSAGYIDAVQLDIITFELRKRYMAEVSRNCILNEKGGKRLGAILKLYRSGGYAYFRGWMSFTSDLIFRYLFRL